MMNVEFLAQVLKLKLFGVLSSIDIVVLVRRFFTQATMPIDVETPNGLSLCFQALIWVRYISYFLSNNF